MKVRISDPSSRPDLVPRLRKAVRLSDGKLISELMDGKGFMFVFSDPPHFALSDATRFSIHSNAPNPLSSYAHGQWLEEGRIQVTKTPLEEEIGGSVVRNRSSSIGSSSCDRCDSEWASVN